MRKDNTAKIIEIMEIADIIHECAIHSNEWVLEHYGTCSLNVLTDLLHGIVGDNPTVHIYTKSGLCTNEWYDTTFKAYVEMCRDGVYPIPSTIAV